MQFDPKREQDFLLNEFFMQWIIAPNEESDRYWTQWMSDHPDKSQMLKRAKETALSFRTSEFAMEKEASERILQRVIQRHQDNKSGLGTLERKSGWVQLFLGNRVAAIVVFVAFFLGAMSYYLAPVEEAVVEEKVAWVTKSSKAGTKMTFHLPDGSLVKLNANSKIVFPAQFSDTLREVSLVGQAFFDVQRNEKVPFIVQAGDLHVKVLGTSFDVNSRPDLAVQNVALLTGKVQVSSADGKYEFLNPLQMITYSKERGEMVKQEFDPEETAGWKDGIIKFNNTDFRKVFRTLEEWYDVKITVSEGVHFKGGLNGRYDNEILDNVLAGLSYSEGFKYKIENKQVTIY
ncbi:DUF4974 domain-containing protein [Echinicola sediminis]